MKAIQLQQFGCCPFIRMKVFKAHKEPYYIVIESDSIEYDSLYDDLNKYFKSLKSESIFKDKLEEILDHLDDDLSMDQICKFILPIIYILTGLGKKEIFSSTSTRSLVKKRSVD